MFYISKSSHYSNFIIDIDRMNRKGQGQNSTERILKSKYVDKQRTKIGSNGSQVKKIMLTDLCPQEKLKIGELIKINQNRKEEIFQLSQEIKEIRQKLSECHLKLMKIQEQNQEKQNQCNEIMDENKDLHKRINQYEEKLIGIQIENNKLKLQNQIHLKNAQKSKKQYCKSQSCQTDTTERSNQSAQTKKQKTKHKQIQVQTDQLIMFRELQKNKSKNQEKLTKQNSQILKRRQKSLDSSYSMDRNDRLNSYNSSERDDKEHSQKVGALREHHQLLAQEKLSELAKQWLQLKSQNVNRLAAQYEISRANYFRDEHDDLSEFTYQQIAGSSKNKPERQKQQQQDEEIDENELNNLLKSKNFSASRLLTSKGLLNQSQNSRKGSQNAKGSQQKLQKNPKSKTPSFNQQKLKISSKQQQRILKSPAFIKVQQGQGIYSSDFMDIVDSLNY